MFKSHNIKYSNNYAIFGIGLFLASSAFFSTRTAAAQTTARTYYVAPGGSDGNNGSQSNPLATIERADALVAPGDTVIVLDGTYRGDTILRSSGTSGHPITYVAQHKWGAKLVGTGSGDGSFVIGISGAHVVVQNFDITGTDANGIILAYAGKIASYNQAINNYVHDMITPCDSNSGTAISTGGGDNYTGISHNDIIGNLVVNITPYNGCPGGHVASGIYGQTPNATIANNVVINAGTNIQTWHAANSMMIYGNTSIGGVVDITLGAGDSGMVSGGVQNSLVANNICIGATSVGLQEHGTTGANNVFTHNLVYGNPTNIELLHGHLDSALVTADPKLENNTGTAFGDYRLQSTSPARGTGIAISGVTTDYLGYPRPQSGSTDIGAALYTATTVPLAPTITSSAKPASISAGQSTVLTWASQNAAKVTLNGALVGLSGSASVSPSATTSYTLVATNSAGASVRSTVTVTVQAVTGTVAAGASASPKTITRGQSSVISWNTINAVSATLNGQPVPLHGSMTVSPTQTTTYRIVGTGATGATDWGSATVTVN